MMTVNFSGPKDDTIIITCHNVPKEFNLQNYYRGEGKVRQNGSGRQIQQLCEREDGHVLCNYDGNGVDKMVLPAYISGTNYHMNGSGISASWKRLFTGIEHHGTNQSACS